MRRRILLIINFFVIVVFTGCNRDALFNADEAILFIDLGSLDEKTFPGDLINEATYLKLETNEECLIRNIDKIKFSNELIYIMDKLSRSIFVFNMDGKFMKKYHHYGRGPGEYINLDDFDITRDGKFIYMLDFSQYKVIKYSIDNKFINEIRLEFGTASFACIDDNLLIFHQGNRINPQNRQYNYDIVYLDFDSNKPLRGYFPVKDRRMKIANYALFSSGEQLFYMPYSTAGVYKINKDGLTKFISFSGVNQIEEKAWNNEEFIRIIHESDYHFLFRNFYIIEDLISFAFNHNQTQYRIFYSINSGTMVYGVGFPFNDPNRLPGNFEIIGTYKDNFVTSISPSNIMRKSYEIFPIYKDHPELHSDLIKLSKATSINDNPIIAFFKINID